MKEKFTYPGRIYEHNYLSKNTHIYIYVMLPIFILQVLKRTWRHQSLQMTNKTKSLTSITLICLLSWVGNFSSSTSLTAALPLNKSMVIPGGNSPWCCCHFNAWEDIEGGEINDRHTLLLYRRTIIFNFKRQHKIKKNFKGNKCTLYYSTQFT